MHIDRTEFWDRLRALKERANETTVAVLERVDRVVCDGGFPSPQIFAVGGLVGLEWTVAGHRVILEFADIIVGEVDGGDGFDVPASYPHDSLIADVRRLLTRAGWNALDAGTVGVP